MSDSVRSPTAVRRELGQRLRGLRLERDLTVTEVAEGIGCSASKVTKIELAQLVAAREDVLKLLDLYGQTDAGQREVLLALVRQGNRKEWWEGHRDLPPKFGNYLGLESVCSTLHAYDTHVVHGLLQTPDYARALFTAGLPERLPHEIDHLVALRIRRQEILTRTDPEALTLWSLLDEAVLRRPIGGHEVMRAQIEYLIEKMELPNVNVLLLPNELGAHAGLVGPFAMLQFEADARPVIYVEGQAGNLYLEKDADLRRCRQTLNHLLAAAPQPKDSMTQMRRIAEEMTG